MSRMSKLRIGAAIAGVLLLLLVLVVGLLHTPPAQRYVLRRVRDYLYTQGIEFDSSGLDYNLLALSTTLRNARVQSLADPDLPPLLEADSVFIDLNLLGLLGGSFILDEGRIDGLRIHVQIDEDGATNFPVTTPQDVKRAEQAQGTGLPEVVISSLKITDGTLVLDDRRDQLGGTLPGLAIEVQGEAATLDHQLELVSHEEGVLTYQGRSLPLRNVHLDTTVSEFSAARLDDLSLEVGSTQFKATGDISDFSNPLLDIVADADLKLKELQDFAGLDQGLDGDLSARVTLKDRLDDLKIAAHLEGNQLAVADWKPLDLEADVKLDQAAQRLQVESLTLRAPVGTLKGTADLALPPSPARSSANLQVGSLDLAALSRQLGLELQIAGRASGQLNFSWSGTDFLNAGGQADLRVTPTASRVRRNVLPVSASLRLDAQPQQVKLQLRSLEALGARLSGQISVASLRDVATNPKGSLGGSIQGDIDNLEATVAGLDALLGKSGDESLIGIPLAGSVSLQADLGGTLSNPTASAAVRAPALQVGELENVSLDARLAYRTDQLNVNQLVVDWQGQQLRVDGTVELAGENPALNLQAQVDSASVPSLVAALDQDLPVEGVVSLRAAVGGTTAAPSVALNLSGSGLSAYQEPLGQLEMEAVLENQRVKLTRLQLDKPALDEGTKGSLQATGSYDLQTQAYQLSLSTKDFRLVGLTLPGEIPVRGDLDLSVEGAGTVEDPALKLTAALQELSVSDTDLGDVSANAALENGTGSLAVEVPKYSLLANARVGVDAPYPAEVEIRASGTDLTTLPFEPPSSVSLQGTVTATVRGRGDLERWQEGQLTARVENLDVSVNGQPIKTEGPLEISYAAERLTVSPSTLLLAGSRLTLEGDLPLTQSASPGEIKLAASVDLDGLAEIIPTQEEFAADGELRIDGSVRGSLQQLTPNLNVNLDEGSFLIPGLAEPVIDASLKVRLTEGRIKLDTLTAQVGVGHVEASAEIPLGILPLQLPLGLPQAQGPASLHLSVDNLQAGVLSAVPDSVNGTISLRLDAAAPRAELEAVSAQLQFDELEVQVEGFELRQEQPVTIAVENGIARIEQFRLTGPETEISATGSLGLTGDQPLDVRVDGSLDAGVLALFVDDIRAGGKSQLELALNGSLSEPEMSGFFELQKGQIDLRTPRLQVSELDVRVEMAGNKVTVQELSGELNGGSVQAGGGLEVSAGGVENLDLTLTADNVFLDFPPGLQTLSTTDLKIRSQADSRILVSGSTLILEGSYTDPIQIGDDLLKYLRSEGGGVDLFEEQSPLLSKIRFDIDVETVEPVYINNNLARLALEMDTKLRGNYYRPGLTGQVTLEEGGEIELRERTFLIERGAILFNNETRIEPSVDLVARTQVAGHNITLQVSGGSGDLETSLTSDDGDLTEPDVIALLVTGRTLDSLRGAEATVAKEQTLSILAGGVAGRLGRGLEEATGLSRVRIEPNLISGESTPGARLTIGQDLTRDLEFIYSMNLVDSSDQIYIAEYDLTKRFTARVLHRTRPESRDFDNFDNSYTFEFNHDIRFGGLPTTGKDVKTSLPPKEVADVSLAGQPFFDQKKLLAKFKVKPGDDYNFFKVRKGMDRLEKFYDDQGYLEARVRLQRTSPSDQAIRLDLDVNAGPVVEFAYTGASVSKSVRGDVRKLWAEGIFDAQRADDAERRIRGELIGQGYLEAEVTHEIDSPASDRKLITFQIDPGVQYRDVQFQIEGAAAVPEGLLKEELQEANLLQKIHTEPGKVTDFLRRYYQQEGFLSVEVGEPRYDLQKTLSTGSLVIPIQEGPQFKVAKIDFNGNQAFTDVELQTAIPLYSGAKYTPQLREDSRFRLEDKYWRKGYNDVAITYKLERSETEGEADLSFDIQENRQEIVQEIVVEGNDQTSEQFVRNQLEFAPGAILDLDSVTRSRKTLYSTGAFVLVEIEAQQIENAQGVAANQKAVRALVRVREIKPFRFRYGGSYDTERGGGVVADFRNRNSLGSARSVGVRAEYNNRTRELRGFFSQPLLRDFPVKSNAVTFFRQDRNPVANFRADRLGFSLQQEVQFKNKYILSYGYRYERVRLREIEPNPFFPLDFSLSIAPLTATITQDRRDEILDATRGSFNSQAFEFAPALLGSDLRFVRYYGQYFRYLGLTKPRQVPFGGDVKRPRLVYAGGVRVGLAKPLGGQSLVSSERFFAGGGTTVRGFEEDRLGPLEEQVNENGETVLVPAGGEAVFILNNELRFPLFSIFEGVTFVDVGNVYRNLSDFNPFDARAAGGFGLRVRTPYFLLRADYGFKFNRRPGESSGAFFFSIGQAF